MSPNPYQNIVFRNKSPKLTETLQIYDVTLRDGEQHPLVRFSMKQKLEIVKKMIDFGIEMIEGGFPAISNEEFETLKKIITLYPDVKIYAFCRTRKDDIDLALKAGAKYIVTFLPSSKLHLEKKLNLSLEKGLKKIDEIVKYAVSNGLYVRFSCEDATRTSFDRLKKIFHTAINAGTGTIGIADTIGVMTPSAMKIFVRRIHKEFPEAKISVHCHNDYGLATANTLAAIEAGAHQVHTSLCGLGERSGNTSFEELICILKYQYNYRLNYKFEKLHDLLTTLYRISNIPRPHIKAVCGINSFVHESGIHVKGLLKDEATYSPFPPQDIGRETEVAFGKHSGRSNLLFLAQKHNITIPTNQIDKILQDLKKENV